MKKAPKTTAFRVTAIAATIAAIAATSSIIPRSPSEGAANDSPLQKNNQDIKNKEELDSPTKQSIALNSRTKIENWANQKSQFSDIESELRIFAASEASSSAKLSILELLANSGMDSFDFEKAVDLFCDLETDNAFRLSAIQLISSGFKRSEIARKIFSSAKEADLPRLASELARFHNDRERQTLIRNMIRSVLPESSLTTLHQWISANLDPDELPEATGTLLSSYADSIKDGKAITPSEFKHLTKHFDNNALQPVAISYVRQFASRGDTDAISSILHQYPIPEKLAIVEDAINGMTPISPEAIDTFEGVIRSFPEDLQYSIRQQIDRTSK